MTSTQPLGQNHIFINLISAVIEKLTKIWKVEGLVIHSEAYGIPNGYQTLTGLVDGKALTLREAMAIGKELLTIICNLHSHELVQEDLTIYDVFVKVSMSVSINKVCLFVCLFV